MIRPIEWSNGKVRWLDVSKIPFEEVYHESNELERLAQAIERMEVRGAPAIGVFAALSLAAVAYNIDTNDINEFTNIIMRAADRLRRTRPTAYNLFWAINRVLKRVEQEKTSTQDVEKVKKAILDEALAILNEDIEQNKRMGQHGASIINDGDIILTHCNTGALATAGYGTALGVIRAAWEQGKKIRVIATETRPLLQGARLTVWELVKEGIPVTLVTDNMVGYVLSKGLVNKILVGADRILLTGHVVNKIGTYTIAVLANRHNVPFYAVAPTSTIDPETNADDVVIEERDPDEVRTVLRKIYITMKNVPVINPAFDITPPELVTGIITEKGIAYPPYEETLKRILQL